MKGFTAWLKDKWLDIKDDCARAHHSFTVWFNGIWLTVIEAIPYAKEAFPELQAYVTPEFYRQAMTVLIVGNIVLRFKTTRALRHK